MSDLRDWDSRGFLNREIDISMSNYTEQQKGLHRISTLLWKQPLTHLQQTRCCCHPKPHRTDHKNVACPIQIHLSCQVSAIQSWSSKERSWKPKWGKKTSLNETKYRHHHSFPLSPARCPCLIVGQPFQLLFRTYIPFLATTLLKKKYKSPVFTDAHNKICIINNPCEPHPSPPTFYLPFYRTSGWTWETFRLWSDSSQNENIRERLTDNTKGSWRLQEHINLI